MLKEKPRAYRRPHPRPDNAFLRDVLQGLSRQQKTLPCRYFYDARGSALFEEITELPQYYPTRTEAAILRQSAGEMVSDTPRDAVLVEFGSGSSRKTELLLESLPHLRAYIMIDVSQSALDGAADRLGARFPGLDIRAVVGDFSQPMTLDAQFADAPRIGFFPGSTIGNLAPPEAQRLLRSFKTVLGNGSLIVGVDLKKSTTVLLPAYNDAAGVTAAFNLNLLHRINRELGADIDVTAFRHEAIYNERDGRIEMHLVACRETTAIVGGVSFHFAAGETIHTENSYKYGIEQFRGLAASAGWQPGRVWTDANGLFSVHELTST